VQDLSKTPTSATSSRGTELTASHAISFELTSGILSEIKSNSKRIKALNATPYMGGDYRGFTFYKGEFVGKPTAQAIKSRARYASTLALASFVRDPQRFGDVLDKFKVKLETELPVLCLIYGCVEPPFASPFKLVVKNVEGADPWFTQVHEPKDRYNALLRRGRSEAERKFLRPAKPFSVSFEIEIFREDRRLEALFRSRLKGRTVEISRIINLMQKIFEESIYVALTLFGIGKGASRGFGRFWIRRELPRCEDVQRHLDALLSSWEELLNLLSDLGLLTNKPQLQSGMINGKVPHLGHLKGRLCQDYLKHVRGNIDYKIERIAEAVLKASWKRKVRAKDGLSLHTWPLGLPRSSKIACACKPYDTMRRYNRYGYLVVKGSKPYFCEHYCGRGSIGSADARRESMITFVPVEEGILVVPLFSLDVLDLINGSKGTLYHVGGSFVRKKKGGSPCCNRRFVSVDYAMSGARPQFARSRGAGCWCRSPSRTGINAPPVTKFRIGARASNSLQALYLKALEAALNWTYYLL